MQYVLKVSKKIFYLYYKYDITLFERQLFVVYVAFYLTKIH